MKPMFWHFLIITLGLILSPTVAPTVAAPSSTESDSATEYVKETSSDTATSGTDPIAEEENPTVTEEEPEETVEVEKTENSEDAEVTSEDLEHKDISEEEEASEASEAEAEAQRRREILIEADKLYVAEDYAAAEALYRQVKSPFAGNEVPDEFSDRPLVIYDPELLSPGGQVYWREGNAGIEQNLETRIFIPLELLVEKYPEFIPGHLLLTQVLEEHERLEEAIEVLDRATTLYPEQTDLLHAQIDVLVKSKQYLEASIAARQFALINPEHPEAEEFATSAEVNYDKFRSYLKKTDYRKCDRQRTYWGSQYRPNW